MTKKYIILSVLMVTAALANYDFRCPQLERIIACRCHGYEDWWHTGAFRNISVVNCSFSSLPSIPQLTSFKITKFTKFLLNGNNITKLKLDDFLFLSSVAELDLSHNPIEFLENNTFSSISESIVSLVLEKCHISLDEGLHFLRGLELLEELNLAYNSVKNVHNHLPNDLFRHLRLLSLKKLSLNSCGIVEIRRKAFEGLTALEEMDISYNDLESVPEATWSLTNLRKLVLKSNNILNITNDSFRGLHNLQVLDLNINFISQIQNGGFNGLEGSLKELKLFYNDLVDIPTVAVRKLHKLHSLVLSRNKIQFLNHNAFAGLHNLKMLELNMNPLILYNEMFAGLEDTLETLNLRQTGLMSLPTNSLLPLKKLTDLDLSLNQISNLDGIGKLRLRNLALENNNIQHLQMESFKGLRFPVGLDLDNNNITSLSFILDMKPCSFSYLDVVGNPIMCDCDTEVIINSGRISGLSGACSLFGEGPSLDIGGSRVIRELTKVCNMSERIYTCQNIQYFGSGSRSCTSCFILKSFMFIVFFLTSNVFLY